MVIDPNFGAFQPFLRDLQNRDSEASRIRDAKAKEEKSENKGYQHLTGIGPSLCH